MTGLGAGRRTYCERVRADEPPVFRLLPDSDEPEPAAAGLPPGRPDRFSPVRRRLAVALVVLGVLTGLAVQRHRSESAARDERQQLAAASAAAIASASRAAEAGLGTARSLAPAWPSTPDQCGAPGMLQPIMITKPLREPTGIRLTIGGEGVRQVNLDDGSVSPVPGQALVPAGTMVMDRQRVGTADYLMTATCGAGARVLRVPAGQPPVALSVNPASAQLYPDGAGGIWASTYDGPGTNLSQGKLTITMIRLDRPGQVTLPPGLWPLAIHANLLLATAAAPTNGEIDQRLVSYDLAKHRMVRDFGPLNSVAQTQGMLLWTPQPCSAASTCQLHSYQLATGTVSSRAYSLPEQARLTGAVLSADRDKLAFQLPRMSDDPRYYTTMPGTPSDLVVLDLRSGVLEPIPNLELAPGETAGLAFSADGRWLVIALNSAGGYQLLAWRSGLNNPLAAVRLPGSPPQPLPLQLEPAG